MSFLKYNGAPITTDRISRVGNRIQRRLRFAARQRLGYSDITAETYWGSQIKLEFRNPSAWAMISGSYEPDEMKTIGECVMPGMTVLDVGANVGYMTLFLANRVGDSGRVHAFEPNPRVAKSLHENLALNPAQRARVSVHSFALGAREGVTEFYSPVQGHEGVGGLRNTARAELDQVLKVEVRTLDGFVSALSIERVDFIKMDVEGGEWDILRGGERVLDEHRPTILFEAFDGNTSAYGYRVFELLSYLEKRGYEVTQPGWGCNFIARPVRS